jgi:hypothetical protein
MSLSIRFAILFLAAVLAGPSFAADVDWSQVGKALGKDGAMQPGGVYKVSLPRTDLRVALDGVTLKPGFALGSWLGFQPVGSETMVMGDLVLAQDEIAPVMKKLEQEGISITGLHNHLLRAEPATMYMHVLGHGDPVKLAQALHAGLALSKTPLGGTPAASQQGAIDLDKASIDKIMGAAGKVNGGVLQYSINRKDKIMEDGMEVPPALGTAIGINFQPTGGGKAAISGDFVLTAQEVNAVIRALQAGAIEVTALHNHMLEEQPRLFFMHVWANADAEKLAKGLRSALDKTNVSRG